MTRRKGEIGKRQIDRDWRFQVEFEVPPGGLRGRLDAMSAYTVNRDCKWRPSRLGVRDATRVCWRTSAEAEAFRAIFGGALIEIPERGWAFP